MKKHTLVTTTAAFLAVLAFAVSCSRHDDHDGHDHSGHDHAPAKVPAKAAKSETTSHATHDSHDDHAGHDHAGHSHAGHDHDKKPAAAAKQDDHAGHDHDHAPAKAAKQDDHAGHSHDHTGHAPAGHDHDHAGHSHAGHSHAGHSHGGRSFEDGNTAPNFDPERGLQFPPEVLQVLALKTSVAENRPLAAGGALTVQVFATSPRVLASVLVPEAQAAMSENASFAGAKLLRVDRATSAATRLAELVFALDTPGAPGVPSSQTQPQAQPHPHPHPHPHPQTGDFVTIAFSMQPRVALAVPRDAILESSDGDFVYVAGGDWYLRTPVKTGIRSPDYVEITGGLSAGAVVAASSVKDLWLVELLLTKGGGHAH